MISRLKTLLLLTFIPIGLLSQIDTIQQEYTYKFYSHSGTGSFSTFTKSDVIANYDSSATTVFGLVKDSNGKPVKNVKCEFIAKNNQNSTLIYTDENGKFQKNLIPDIYDLMVNDSSRMSCKLTSINLRKGDAGYFEVRLEEKDSTTSYLYVFKKPISKRKQRKIQRKLDKRNKMN